MAWTSSAVISKVEAAGTVQFPEVVTISELAARAGGATKPA
jgi:hypothetical protein